MYNVLKLFVTRLEQQIRTRLKTRTHADNEGSDYDHKLIEMYILVFSIISKYVHCVGEFYRSFVDSLKS